MVDTPSLPPCPFSLPHTHTRTRSPFPCSCLGDSPRVVALPWNLGRATDTGRCFVFGDSEEGQLGTGDGLTFWEPVELMVGDRAFREIACGPRHLLFLLEPLEAEDKAWVELQSQMDAEANPRRAPSDSDSDSDDSD